MLLASGVPGMAQTTDSGPTNQLDLTGLLYGEAHRVRVTEPTARFTRLYPDGHSYFAQLGIDAITGASPSGALPTGQSQTVTSASGNVQTVRADEIPQTVFKDTRVVLDGGWDKPLGRLSTGVGGHFSREKDYESLGATGKFSIDFDHRLTTLTMGAGFNHDGVFPVGGTRAGLADPSVVIGTGSNSKQVTTGMIGVSRILTRRWMMGFNASRTYEQGYLTEPYKVLSVVDGATGLTTGQLTDSRPGTRNRTSVLANSVYHLSEDVFYSSYRYYWDDWGVRSHTFDLKYRHELENETYVEPHLRYYAQTGADFFRFGLIQGAPLPDFATSDYRLGPLRSVTLGATIGFRPPGSSGEWSVRAEYIGQYSDGHPKDAVGVQRQYDLYPTVNTGSLVIGYTLGF
jgi:hypothetical protein